ncbi:hypothetical protein E3N88_38945 [Mikania micrantha]|uniref:Dol-P-Glc:Glc(2)Man(9)GlcNAc(2)-PP-Dol alpha-1,2-glucosyltransferase n=1 Tax=Mikania micrantha TaxID=192012 RepID=A0A5N6LVF2_9ASTR|nr:hypothetical protein E3N88_38945 [Mikania micrantha]
MGRLIVALIVSSWVIPMSILVNLIVPEPYMDEIFHVPQAQQYCVGNFKSWDPMITTPPGLIAHPYLLADNRHYPFYLWRKIINAHWSTRYLLVPLYVYSWASILNILAKVQEKVWVLAYFVASAAVLVPAPLIEFRYYTIPFFFLIIHCPFIGTMNLEFKGLFGRKRVGLLQEMTK